MPLVAVVRHGQASFGAADYDALSDLGRRQAEAVGVELARRGLRDPELVCGTLRRQRDTAEILAKPVGIGSTATIDRRWNEFDHDVLLERYIDPERAAHAHDDSRVFQTLLDEALAAWSRDGGETGWSAFARDAVAALRDVTARLPTGRDAIVVSSGGVIGALAAGLLGAPAATAIAMNRMAVNCAITSVILGATGANLLSFNDHAHFMGPRRNLQSYR